MWLEKEVFKEGAKMLGVLSVFRYNELCLWPKAELLKALKEAMKKWNKEELSKVEDKERNLSRLIERSSGTTFQRQRK